MAGRNITRDVVDQIDLKLDHMVALADVASIATEDDCLSRDSITVVLNRLLDDVRDLKRTWEQADSAGKERCDSVALQQEDKEPLGSLSFGFLRCGSGSGVLPRPV